MSHGTKIGGTSYGVTGGKCLIGGTAYAIKKGRTLIGGTGYDIQFGPDLSPVLSDNSWDVIVWACHNNAVPSTWTVGDSKKMLINNREYQIDIIGKDHDTYTSGGIAPITFQMHDCYADMYGVNDTNANMGGYGSSVMHNVHLPEILELMPVEVQDGIRQVDKLATAGNQSSTIATIPCKLFLLSEIEIFGKNTYSGKGEGSQYAYYSDGNSKIKNLDGSAISWWERSPYTGSYNGFCRVSTSGKADLAGSRTAYGVACGFCF